MVKQATVFFGLCAALMSTVSRADDAAAPTDDAAPGKAVSSVRLLFLGDSLTSCSRVARDFASAQLSFRRPLWALLGERKRTKCTAVVGPRSGCNSRVDGNLADKVATFPQAHDAYFGRTLESVLVEAARPSLTRRPAVVVAWLGLNDLMAGKSPDTVTHQLRRLLRTLWAGGVRHVLLLTLPGVDPARGGRHRQRFVQVAQGAAQVNGALRDAAFAADAAAKQVGDQTDATGSMRIVDVAQGYDAARHTYDGLHPNDAGEAHVAAVVADALEALLPADDACAT